MQLRCLVIDVGTSSMRGILYDVDATILLKKQLLHAPKYLTGGRVEQSAEMLRDNLYEICRSCSGFCAQNDIKLDVIVFTSQRSSVMMVDKNKNVLSDIIMWHDKRTLDICEELKTYNSEIFQISGANVNPVFAGSKMRWIRQEEQAVYNQADKFVVIPDYIGYLMTGNLVTDYSYASRTSLFDLREKDWNDKLLEIFNVERTKLLECVPSGSIIGVTSKEFCDSTKLPENICVISAGGDQQCAGLGNGVINEGVVQVTVGTGAYILATTKQIPKDLKDDIICHMSAGDNGYMLESSILTASCSFDWFLKEFYSDTLDNSKDKYEMINKDISKVQPGANGVIVLPYFQGRASPDWNSQCKASFHNVTLSTTKQDLARALVEGICYEINENLLVAKQYVTKINSIRICGGLSKSAEFNQMLADICGVEVMKFSDLESTSLGAWIVAAVKMEYKGNLEEAFEFCRKSNKVQIFKPKIHLEYEKGKVEFKRLYQKNN